MRCLTSRLTPAILMLAAVGLGGAQSTRPPTWQADVQIRTLEITKSRSGISARVVVFTENDDEALDARLLILLPVGVGVERRFDSVGIAAQLYGVGLERNDEELDGPAYVGREGPVPERSSGGLFQIVGNYYF